MIFKVYIADRSTALCPICRQHIEKGKRTLKANLGSGDYASRFHLDCFVDLFSDTIKALYFHRLHLMSNRKRTEKLDFEF